jgi:hypothetical protein
MTIFPRKTLYEVRIRLHKIDQTNKNIYNLQIYYSCHELCYKMSGGKGTLNKYYSCDN